MPLATLMLRLEINTFQPFFYNCCVSNLLFTYNSRLRDMIYFHWSWSNFLYVLQTNMYWKIVYIKVCIAKDWRNIPRILKLFSHIVVARYLLHLIISTDQFQNFNDDNKLWKQNVITNLFQLAGQVAWSSNVMKSIGFKSVSINNKLIWCMYCITYLLCHGSFWHVQSCNREFVSCVYEMYELFLCAWSQWLEG